MGVADNDNSWADEPITSSADDTYGRKAFAAMVAETIAKTGIGAASTVFGLLGPWGSGKTSVAAIVEEHLPSHWTVQQFTPWVAADRAALQLEFLTALDAALGGQHAEEKAARERLAKFAEWAAPMLGIVPTLGGLLSNAADRVAENLTSRGPWSAEFQEMADALGALGRPLLIVCDDIDRLDAKELLEFLKVIRLLGRFPNVHYLVAYDPETVDELLDAEGLRGRSTSFMDKIVQHPFELPDLDYATRFEHVSEFLHLVISRNSLQLNEEGVYRLGKLVDALSSGLATPRQISRLRENINATTTLILREVDFLDFAALTYLRLNHHEIYASLPGLAESLRAGLPSDGQKKSEQRTLEEWQETIATKSAGRSETGAWDVISFLFPHLGPWFQYREHTQAYSDPEYTERYHTMGVPSNDVPDLVVERAMLEISNPGTGCQMQQRLAEFIDTRHESISRLAVAKARRCRGRLRDPADNVVSIVRFIAERMPPVEEENDDYRTPLSALYDWLSEEIFSISSGSGTQVRELSRALGDQRLRALVLRSTAWQPPDEENSATKSFLIEMAAAYVAEIESSASDLTSVVDLRGKLTLIFRSGHADLSSLLAPAFENPKTLLELARALVHEGRLFNGSTTRGQLFFDEELWNKIRPRVNEDIMFALLPESPAITDVDRNDTSEDNVEAFAISAIRHLGSTSRST